MTTILIIDDDVTLLAQLAAYLESADLNVLRASDLIQGEHLASEGQPDAILLDPQLSNGAGWVLLERLAPRIPLIAISGAGLEEDVVRGLDLGAADYLAKPFRMGELLARLRRALRSGGKRGSLPQEPTLPSTTNPVDRLRRSSAEQYQSSDFGERRRAPEALGERRIEVPVPQRARRRTEEEEQSVFISAEEEHQLFTAQEINPDDMRLDEINQLPLGIRLKTARQRRRITLVQAELDTKLRMYYIQAMEEEKFALLPSGVASEEMLRTYIGYLGLDLNSAIDEFRRRHYNAPVAPPTALGGAPLPRQLPRWFPRTISAIVAAVLALAVVGGLITAFDPNGLNRLADQARSLLVAPTPTLLPTPQPPTPTLPPTSTPLPTNTPAPTAIPTVTPINDVLTPLQP
ncbi:MAG: response regulator [Roseiflexaceae bacterium]